MKRLLARSLALTLLAGLTVAVALPVLRRWQASAATPVEFARIDEAVVAANSARAAKRSAEAPGLRRSPLTEEEVTVIIPFQSNQREYDPYVYFRYLPGLSVRHVWPEHPDGAYAIVTNSLGLRQDAEIATPRPKLRVLVAGDSHITGVCANSECFAGQLEARLSAAAPQRTVQVINGAHGAYSFYHYLGTLERLVALGATPDLFVVVVYGGNDFLGAFYWHYFHGTKRPTHTAEQLERVRRTVDETPKAMAQVLNSADYFRRGGPQEVALGIEMARQVTAEIQRQCDALGTELLVVYLPSPADVPARADQRAIQLGAEILHLSTEELGVNLRMGERYLEQIADAGTATLDLRPVFEALDTELYWRKDLHLALAGQSAAATAVAKWIEARPAP